METIGVDLGGTFIKFGLVNSDGKIIRKTKIPSNADNGSEKVIDQIIYGITELLNHSNNIVGVGIGSPGIVDSEKGIVKNPPNFNNWSEIPVKEILSKKFNLNVTIDNDANAAAIGELVYGEGKYLKNFIMVTLGTGVGGGIVINKKLYRGSSGAGGEFGHTLINFNGPKCKCGSKGCLEAYIGSNYLINRSYTKLKKFPHSKIHNLLENNSKDLTPKLIHEASILNDDLAKMIIVETGEYLGYALSSIINLLDIGEIIIGGGISGFGELLIESIEKIVNERVLVSLQKTINIRNSKLNNSAGILGASALALYKDNN